MATTAGPPRTLFDKVWDSHVVLPAEGSRPDLLYVDLHLVHEVSSPQAFEQLRALGLRVRRPELTLATADHSVSTSTRNLLESDDQARQQVDTLERNCTDFDVPYYGVGSSRQGIVHVIGPELGLTRPGTTIVCGDSHTSTHGAFGAIAFGIGTSEVAHVLATQCLWQRRPRTLLIRVGGMLPDSVTSKDLILHLIAQHGPSGAAGHAVEYRGPAVTALSMEARMTLCNMSIEAGARVGMIAPDETTLRYLEGRAFMPSDPAELSAAIAEWQELVTDHDAVFDTVWTVDAAAVAPMVTWGTNPSMGVAVTGSVPRPEQTDDPAEAQRALEYMGLVGGEPLSSLVLDRVFIGSCTNGRIEDLRAAAAQVRGRAVAEHVRAIVVPGSDAVRRQAQDEGLDKVFVEAGFEWRYSGCSMCVAMNADKLSPGQRCASTSNRNFQGRQGAGGRTHLVSPAMAAAAAIAGHFIDVREDRAPT